MSDTTILQAILDNVVTIKSNVKRLEEKMDKGFKDVNKRIDILGNDLAILDDDSPTREEHNTLKKRVVKIEKKLDIQTS
ncbi:hypothetical protein BH10PAT1_BH10PAT1_0130 [soil metagenome]